MKVAQVMNARPVTVHADTSVVAALRRLAVHAITMLPVVDRQGRITGVVAEGDLLQGEARAEHVSDVMRHLTALVHPETDVRDADRLLRDCGVKSLPVVDAADQVVGVVSRSDIVRLLARDDAQLQQEIVDALCRAGVRGWRVEVHNGVVDLCGPKDVRPETADEAVGTARGTLGVRDVQVS